ncbi:conserved exported hypothetical protein [Brochothrix thermosphacta]|nr:conserved exported hypothetical protein [Brochothrix thermosphacta]
MMKHKYKIILLGLLMILLLSACQKQTDPKAAAESYVDTYIYGKDNAKFNDFFEDKTSDIKKESKSAFVKELSAALELDHTYDANLSRIYESLNKKLQDETKFKAETIENKEGKAQVVLMITGLTEWQTGDFEKEVIKDLTAQKVKITHKTTDKELSNIAKNSSLRVINKKVNEVKANKKAQKITMLLVQDPEFKEKWIVQNEDEFLKQLSAKFGLN